MAGALTFLRSRPDVDPQRIGGLGLSTGADVLVEVAAEQPGQLAAVVDLMERTAPTPMLLIAGGSILGERELNARYARAGGPTVELWDLPYVDHTAGIRQAPDEYERRMVGLFDRELRAADATVGR